MPQFHLLDWSTIQLRHWLEEHQIPAYRAVQVRRWLYEKRASHWEEMSDLGRPLRTVLASSFRIWTSKPATHLRAADGTEKLLLDFNGGGQVECVLLRDRVRRTLCISTQVGCGMGCAFCASGLSGLQRNLTSGEIVEQMLHLQRLLAPEERISHIVVMGMGEPLANLDALLRALDDSTCDTGLGISARRITISTVGLPQAIDRLAEMAPQYRLAVSLHAPNDALRNQLVPTNKNIGLAAILSAADRYFEASGRRLTFEYVLLADVNDQPQHARELAQRLGTRTALLNVIPYNPVPGLPYRTPGRKAQMDFRRILERSGLRVQFRHRKGNQINAACGQLRRALVER